MNKSTRIYNKAVVESNFSWCCTLSGGNPSQSFLRRGALSTSWAAVASCTPWVVSRWFRRRTRKWPPQRSLTSGSKSQVFEPMLESVCSLLLCLFGDVTFFLLLLGMRMTRSNGAACWGRCVMLPAPPVCLSASTLPGCQNCRQIRFSSFAPSINASWRPPLPPASCLWTALSSPSWSLTLISLWTQMIFICKINTCFCCHSKDCAIPTA